MKFSQLLIQTQRSAPSDLRTDGLAFLYRAGYLSRSLEQSALGAVSVDKLRLFLESAGNSSAQLAAALEILVLKPLSSLETGQIFVETNLSGQDVITCPGCGYSAPRQLARVQQALAPTEAMLEMEKVYTPGCSTIAQLAEYLGVTPEKTAKALMFTRISNGEFLFVVVRGDTQLSEAKLQAHTGEFRPATLEEIAASGAIAGFASPVGLRVGFVIVDELVARARNLVAGANEKEYHLENTNYPRDYRAQLVLDVTLAKAGDPCPICQEPLIMLNGLALVETGQVDYDRLLQVLAERYHDDKGLVFPISIAPFAVYLMNVPGKTLDTTAAALEMYSRLSDAGISVLFDDRDERAGVKFNDADLIGCPVRITVGERSLQNGMVELKRRSASDNQMVAIGDILPEVRAAL